MSQDVSVTALDIGSSAVKALRVSLAGKEPRVLGLAVEPSSGVRKGVIDNIQTCSQAIGRALDKVAQTKKHKIQKVLANIGGSHIFVMSSRGGVAVSRADQRISREDMDRALASAQAVSLASNKEILEVWPRDFAVDGEGGIKEPIGMRGIRLDVEILAMGGFSPYIKNAEEAVVGAGAQVLGLIPSPLASARAVLTARQKDLGAVVIDIGARTTDIAIFEEGELVHIAVLPVGSSNITDDIAIGLRIDIDVAERIKKELGLPVAGRHQHKINNPKRGKVHKASESDQEDYFDMRGISQKTLKKITEARLSDIFDAINKELKKASSEGFLPAGAVLTGGGAQLNNILDFAKKELKLPCRIGFPAGIQGLPKDPSLAVACGLALEALEGVDMEGKPSRSVAVFGSKIKSWFKMFIP